MWLRKGLWPSGQTWCGRLDEYIVRRLIYLSCLSKIWYVTGRGFRWCHIICAPYDAVVCSGCRSRGTSFEEGLFRAGLYTSQQCLEGATWIDGYYRTVGYIWGIELMVLLLTDDFVVVPDLKKQAGAPDAQIAVLESPSVIWINTWRLWRSATACCASSWIGLVPELDEKRVLFETFPIGPVRVTVR